MKVVLVSMLAIAVPVVATAEPEEVREDHWLWSPTPRAQMRGLSVGDTPYTVDAGHAMVELHPVDVVWASDGEMDERSTDVGQTTLKVGVTDRVDAQVAFSPYHAVHQQSGSVMFDEAGAGDTTLRVRANLFGNDGEGPAVAVMPFVALPTAGDRGAGATWAGVLVPTAVAGPFDGDVTTVFGAAMSPDDDGALQPAASLVSTYSRGLVGPVGFWVEGTVAVKRGEDAAFETHDGLAVAIGDDAEVDVGVHVALPDSSAAINPYINVIVRR